MSALITVPLSIIPSGKLSFESTISAPISFLDIFCTARTVSSIISSTPETVRWSPLRFFTPDETDIRFISVLNTVKNNSTAIIITASA